MEWICLPLISFTAMFNQKEFRIELETFNINSILCTSDYINKISGSALAKKIIDTNRKWARHGCFKVKPMVNHFNIH